MVLFILSFCPPPQKPSGQGLFPVFIPSLGVPASFLPIRFFRYLPLQVLLIKTSSSVFLDRYLYPMPYTRSLTRLVYLLLLVYVFEFGVSSFLFFPCLSKVSRHLLFLGSPFFNNSYAFPFSFLFFPANACLPPSGFHIPLQGSPPLSCDTILDDLYRTPFSPFPQRVNNKVVSRTLSPLLLLFKY